MISILVPVYNVENYLSQCLDSILAQTYKDIEIVMVNDGSTDHSKYIATSYANRYSFIHLYNYENAGISTTRNRLLRHAKGEYVFFVDSDDYIAPQTLQAMMNHMETNNCDIVCCGYTMDYRFGALYRKVETKKVMTKQEALHSLAENKGMNNYPWGKLYKKKCFSNVSFPEFMRGFEDTYTVFKALCNADTIGCITKRYYHYVQHQGSLTHRMNLETAYDMRKAYEYQESCLRRWYPEEDFHFDVHLVNSDFVILYTIFAYYTKKDDPQFVPAAINWKKVNPFVHVAYELCRGICSLRFGWAKTKTQEFNKWL